MLDEGGAHVYQEGYRILDISYFMVKFYHSQRTATCVIKITMSGVPTYFSNTLLLLKAPLVNAQIAYLH